MYIVLIHALTCYSSEMIVLLRKARNNILHAALISTCE